jgi:hypothetical protein
MRLAIALLFAFSVQAITIPTIAGIASLAASSGQIVREGHDLCTHFKATMKKHGRDLRRAVQGKPDRRTTGTSARSSPASMTRHQ